MGDLDEVRAAVSNLIDNAVKYSGSEVQVLVETAAVDDKFISVRVRDQGPGIPKTELKQIFKRFYRVPGPLATRVKGTGLGSTSSDPSPNGTAGGPGPRAKARAAAAPSFCSFRS